MGDESGIAGGVVTHQDLFNSAMREGVACYRIPALVTAPNGDLVAAIDERVASCDDLGTNEDINIVIRRSTDDGMTWSNIETVIDYDCGISASDPSMIVDRDTGEIFLFYNYMDHKREHGIYYLHVARSRDNGLSWDRAEDITPQIAKPEWRADFKFITSGNGIQTRSGVLLHTLVNLDKGVHVFGSRDHGKTWFLVDSPLKPGDESRVVELADGTWMVNSRVKHAGMRYVHTSTDQGKTWTTRPEPALVDPACNAGLIRYTSTADGYDKNRLLFSNAKTKDARRNMTVRVSYDEGLTWTEGKTIYAGGAAYSSLTVLRNGDIGLLFEKDGHKENVFVRFSLEWLTDGQDKYEPPQSR
ncbi:MAG TPA: sialidase family protein [Candidatus Hydrogenedentes bacterium]|nr:sialidase family protein [Candidatus Hydrogenedentota bacterium]HPG66985.1 sialidase family protein [Candidatus Hydrogenedentota bacterium]